MKCCVGCVYEYDWTEPLTAIPEGCKGCKMVDGKPTNYQPKPKTNADRIRAMSDEELAELFCGFCKNAKICEGCPMCDGKCAESELVESWVEWLKQPAEGE